MPFSNARLDPARLPRLEELPLTGVSRAYARYRLAHSLLGWIPALVVLAMLPPHGPWPDWLPLVGAPLLAVLGPLHSGLNWVEARGRAYGLREHDLVYRSGLLVRRTRILPLSRVQHVETVSGPLERLFGLVRLNCFTAGGSSGDLQLAGITSETAADLRDYVLSRIRGGPDREDIDPHDRSG
ncbi:MAG: PH domain-containing protein [Ectothiorhodospiraceae bacterium]|nr:PH domain-containing protein [Ectothiorhodospiraceae bacterium]